MFSLCEAKAVDGKGCTWPECACLGMWSVFRTAGSVWARGAGGWSDHVLRLGAESCPA